LDQFKAAELERRLEAARGQLHRLTLGLRPTGFEEVGLARMLRGLAADTPMDVSLVVPTERFEGEV
jgi:hypothetical protein